MNFKADVAVLAVCFLPVVQIAGNAYNSDITRSVFKQMIVRSFCWHVRLWPVGRFQILIFRLGRS